MAKRVVLSQTTGRLWRTVQDYNVRFHIVDTSSKNYNKRFSFNFGHRSRKKERAMAGVECLASVDKLKAVVVGDPNVGKTSLLKVYDEGKYDDSYTPTGDFPLPLRKTNNKMYLKLVLNNYAKVIHFDGARKDVLITLWDTAGSEGLNLYL